MQAQQVIEVATNRLCRPTSRRDIALRRHNRGRRQQLELQIMRQLQLAAHPLLAQVALHQPRILDRRTDLIGDRRDELAVAGGERVFSRPVREIDDADRRGYAPRRRVHDRHREKRMAAIAALDRVGGLLGALVVGVGLAEHPVQGDDLPRAGVEMVGDVVRAPARVANDAAAPRLLGHPPLRPAHEARAREALLVVRHGADHGVALEGLPPGAVALRNRQRDPE